MYNLRKNNFYKNEKNSTIFTPAGVSDFLRKILSQNIPSGGTVFDPCVGAGSLLLPWTNDYLTIGFDIENRGFPNTVIQDYLSLKKEQIDFTPDLVLINPPFNINEGLKNSARTMGFSGRPLIPELFLAKTIELFGKDTKIVLFSPYGLRLNVDKNSKRLNNFLDHTYPEISSIISLPKDIYKNSGVVFHSEILLFNISGVSPHYFYDERR